MPTASHDAIINYLAVLKGNSNVGRPACSESQPKKGLEVVLRCSVANHPPHTHTHLFTQQPCILNCPNFIKNLHLFKILWGSFMPNLQLFRKYWYLWQNQDYLLCPLKAEAVSFSKCVGVMMWSWWILLSDTAIYPFFSIMHRNIILVFCWEEFLQISAFEYIQKM